jgi:hypothetical protein
MKKTKWKQRTSLAMVVAACSVGGFFVGKFFQTSSVSISNEVAIIIVFTIAFHEAGHAVAGVWMKFNFKMYVVGPFMWVKQNNDWEFKWNTNVNTMGGMVICLPNNTVDLPRRFSFFVAGGPLASLLLVALALVGYYMIKPAAIFIVTIIPMQAGGFASDGARIMRLLRGGEAARLEVLLLKIVADSTGGVRPRLLNKAELEEALHLAKKRKSTFTVYLHTFLYQLAWDIGDIEAAESHLMNYIQEVEAIPEGLQGMVWMEAAFFYALEKKNVDKATEYWQRFKPSVMIPSAQVAALEAALHILKRF